MKLLNNLYINAQHECNNIILYHSKNMSSNQALKHILYTYPLQMLQDKRIDSIHVLILMLTSE